MKAPRKRLAVPAPSSQQRAALAALLLKLLAQAPDSAFLLGPQPKLEQAGLSLHEQHERLPL